MRTLDLLRDEVKSCTKCGLHATRTNTVFSRGNPTATLCFVGEAPGEDEDLQGLPFVGRSGKLLDETVTKLGLDPAKDIYVCNIIKCRPPGNRRPEEEEVNSCIDYLDEQLKLVSPKIVIALGSTSVNALVPANTMGITKIRGKFFKYGIMSKLGNVTRVQSIPLLPTYHPSYVLRNGGKGQVYDDFMADIESAINKAKE